VQPEWESFVSTAKARTKIQAVLRKDRRNSQRIGEKMIEEFLRAEDMAMNHENVYKLCRLHNYHNEEELMVALGNNELQLSDADRNELKGKQSSGWKKLLTFPFGNRNSQKDKDKEKEEEPEEKINTKEVMKLTEEAIEKRYVMADCCHPIPGDDVLGFIDDNDKVIIHKRQCPVAAKLKSGYGNRIIATEWDTHKKLSFLVYIYIKGIDSVGLINEVTQVISRQLNVNIRKLNIETNDGIFEGKIQLWVHDVEDVKTICTNLQKIENIKSVSRIES
jgi:GTP pyrophosphokinase